MITRWKLANFKSVSGEQELEFGPLTIFAGANSTGKSTWIQSILLISQTLAHRISSHSVVLNGALARLGQFDDLLSFGSAENQIVVGWQCRPLASESLPLRSGQHPGEIYAPRSTRAARGMYLSGLTSVSCEIAFGTSGSNAPPELQQLQPSLQSTTLSVSAPAEEGGSPQLATMSIKRSGNPQAKEAKLSLSGELSESEKEALRRSLEYDVTIDEKSFEEIHDSLVTAGVVGCLPRHFLPGRLCLSVDVLEEQARILTTVLQGGTPRALRGRYFLESDIVIPDSILRMLKIALGDLYPLGDARPSGSDQRKVITLRDWMDAMRRPVDRWKIERSLQQAPDLAERITREFVSQGTHETAIRFFSVTTGISRAVFYLDEFFTTGIKYLGPLRDEPKPLYPLPPSPDLADVGLRGEFTAAVLDLHKSQYVDYIESHNFEGPDVKNVPCSVTLQKAVTDWLKYLGVAESVYTIDKGKLGHQLEIKTPGVRRFHDLTHAGVGVSQVLPILVTSLLSASDTALVFEQPELHLHPRVQSRLADFFLSMALLGKQCIIETHSEYLINRLRFRIASAPKEVPLSTIARIYFVEKSGEASTFKEVTVNEFGAITEWPEGFFDQSQDEAERILKAASAKMQSERRSKHDA